MKRDPAGRFGSIVLGLVILLGCSQASTPSPGMSGSPSSSFDPDALLEFLDSVPTRLVQSTLHQLIDLQASVIKAKVDIAIGAWESLDREQRRALLLHLRDGFDQLQRMVAPASGTAATPVRRQGGTVCKQPPGRINC